MRDDETIKALEKALTDVDAPIGENWGSGFLSTQNIRETLDLIHRQAAEKKELEIELTVMRGAANSYRKECAELQREIESCNSKYPFKCKVGNNSEIHSKSIEDYDKLIADISSEARKDFAERLENRYSYSLFEKGGHPSSDRAILVSDMRNLLAEMEERE